MSRPRNGPRTWASTPDPPALYPPSGAKHAPRARNAPLGVAGGLLRRLVRAWIRRGDLDRRADGLDFLELIAARVTGADDPEPAGAQRRIADDRQATNLLPPEPLDLERVHPHLRCRKRAVGVVLIDRPRDRLEVLGLRVAHRRQCSAGG